ncbi:MAG: sulfite exporter TauE/SafE family protein [Clostridiales bacterium]|nr:sulfite exporter TauE/SafE family protein [Clostridiales bacterium]
MEKIKDKEKQDNSKGLKKSTKIVLSVIVSLFVGVANGLFGGGGGMLVVPIFTVLLGLEEKIAHSSAILTILPLSLVSGIIYAVNGQFQSPQGLYVGAGVIIGGLIGTFLMKKFSNNFLRIIFYTLMIIAGIIMLVGKLK